MFKIIELKAIDWAEATETFNDHGIEFLVEVTGSTTDGLDVFNVVTRDVDMVHICKIVGLPLDAAHVLVW